MDDQEIQKLFGRKVREYRKKKGISQEELAELIGKTPDTVSNIERGFAATRIKTAANLADVLDVRLKDLFDLQLLSPDERDRQRTMQHVAKLLAPCDDATLKGAVEVLEAFLKATSKVESN